MVAMEDDFDLRISTASDRFVRCAERKRAAHGQGRGDPGVRAQVWPALFGVSYGVARTEQLRASIPRQRLSIDERSRFSDLAEPLLLSDLIPHYAELAP